MVFGETRSLLARVWWATRGLALVLVVLGMVSTPDMGEGSSLVAGRLTTRDDGLASQELQVPAELVELQTFDVRTATDTEVARLRSAMANRVLRASGAYVLALGNVSRRTAEYEQLLGDRADTVGALKETERGLTALALTSFMSVGVANQDRGLSPGRAGRQWGEGLTAHATDQVAGQRRQLNDDLIDIAFAVEAAEETVDMARDQADAAAGNVNVQRAGLVAFEQRATEHRRESERADRIAKRRSDDVALRAVAGTLIVAAEIEADIDRLVADARREGIDLGGGGYRTASQQRALRLANCDSPHPDTDPHTEPETVADVMDPAARHHVYVVFEAPASACTPPTAPPGASQHQTGQAIDFTSNGSILNSTSPAFRWLQQNAVTYGLENLPGEPWHWSTDGS